MERSGRRTSARLLTVAGVLYLVGGLVLTLLVNVPMNEALASVTVPATEAEARAVWAGYSGRWQVWNTVRTVVSGVSLLLAGVGLAAAGRAATR